MFISEDADASVIDRPSSPSILHLQAEGKTVARHLCFSSGGCYRLRISFSPRRPVPTHATTGSDGAARDPPSLKQIAGVRHGDRCRSASPPPMVQRIGVFTSRGSSSGFVRFVSGALSCYVVGPASLYFVLGSYYSGILGSSGSYRSSGTPDNL